MVEIQNSVLTIPIPFSEKNASFSFCIPRLHGFLFFQQIAVRKARRISCGLFALLYKFGFLVLAEPPEHGFLDSPENILVARAAAQVPGQELAQFIVRVLHARV